MVVIATFWRLDEFSNLSCLLKSLLVFLVIVSNNHMTSCMGGWVIPSLHRIALFTIQCKRNRDDSTTELILSREN